MLLVWGLYLGDKKGNKKHKELKGSFSCVSKIKVKKKKET